MRGACVAIAASVAAAAVWIDADVEPYVRRVVVREDRARGIVEKHRLRRWVVRIRPTVPVEVDPLEAVRRIPRPRRTGSVFELIDRYRRKTEVSVPRLLGFRKGSSWVVR